MYGQQGTFSSRIYQQRRNDKALEFTHNLKPSRGPAEKKKRGKNFISKQGHSDFPGRPAVKTPCFRCRGAGLTAGWRRKIPHANQNIKQKQYCNKFNKDFKNGPHQKVLKKKKKLCFRYLFSFC